MTDFSLVTAQIKKLGAILGAAVKARAQTKPTYGKKIKEALNLAAQIAFEELKTGLQQELSCLEDQYKAALQSRREKLLEAARNAGEPFDDGTRAVRVGVFKLEFEGESATVSLGGVEVERFKEVDGEKLFAKLKELRAALERSPFNRAEFFKQLQASYATCRRAAALDEFVSIRDLHRELVLERARNSEAFRKRPEPKNVPAYPLHQFVFDLARFIQKGAVFEDHRLVTTTPSMRESPSAVSIPNLDHPLGNETRAAQLTIKRNQ